ncbi:hypothetical protein [Streptomyces flavofungini]|uniref:Transferase n=1 Tax=Streptomyces flavofungini TaxID=68200 RepID=A0ABS0XI06_9ACTN|nr:hypothetical protein [Streptomyces flavofungini]MBJ3812828.1 hypothetical protein [Streptomyces flavofungini]GHC79566.1 hypothetical protein GCM10010349_61640 [Streptomyces flavofungini]
MTALFTRGTLDDARETAAAGAPPLAPRADCIADSAGGLTFDVTDPGEAGAAHLLLRLRESEPPVEVRLPLTPAADGSLRAALPSSVELAEGRWNAYAQVEGGEPRRLVPGVNDLRSLVDRAPSGSRGHVAVRIPYATKQGNLSVRAWLRAPHAEVGELRIDDAGLTGHGRVYGTALTGAAHLEAVLRGDVARVLRAGVTPGAAATDFGFTLPYAELADGEGVWDLWLSPAGDEGPRIRLARLLDDVADKKPIFTYPATRVDCVGGQVEVGPYYTNDNDLAVRVAATPA